MAFYVRKSISVGPLRFNLSKSGVGISTGIKGFRLGSGPRGNYVHMGTDGFYYRRTLPPPKGGAVDATPKLPNGASQTHGPLEEITSGCISRMIDTSSAQVLHELNEKKQRMVLWPMAAIGVGILELTLILNGLTAWLTVPLGIIGAIAVVCVYVRDVFKKSVVIMYDLEEPLHPSMEAVHTALTTLSRCGGTWRLDAQGKVYDPKYHAGAGQLITRQSLSVSVCEPPYVRTNVSVFRLSWNQRTLYFLPDRILIFEGEQIGAISYDELIFGIDTTRFIEDGRVPHDAAVVDHTWRYVNKDGGPDRRFNNNHQIPVCLYEVLNLQSRSGLNEIFHLSRTGVSAQLKSAVSDLAAFIKFSLAAEMEREKREEEQRKQKPEDSNFTNHLEGPEIEEPASNSSLAESGEVGVLYILCCVMVADGKASRRERIYIHKQMRRLNQNWEHAALDEEIDRFIAAIKKHGGKRVLEHTIAQIPIIKRDGLASHVLASLNGLISADENVDERELILCSRLTKLLTR